MIKTRTFRVLQGVLVVPQAVKAGPGATNLRLKPGEELVIPESEIGRYIRGRLAAGDLIDVTADRAAATRTISLDDLAKEKQP